MPSERDLQPVSALQHLVFCERQCALMYIEGQWAENRLTTEGGQLHSRADEEEVELRDGVRIVRGLLLRSERLGLIGRADVVEFHPDEQGVALQSVPGRWRPVPVEYKRGRPKPDRCDEVQLCAQAMCLEEALGCAIGSGEVFYGQPRRRTSVVFDDALRSETESTVDRLHELIRAGSTPVARYESKCRSCSLLDLCMPKATGKPRSVERYLSTALEDVP